MHSLDMCVCGGGGGGGGGRGQRPLSCPLRSRDKLQPCPYDAGWVGVGKVVTREGRQGGIREEEKKNKGWGVGRGGGAEESQGPIGACVLDLGRGEGPLPPHDHLGDELLQVGPVHLQLDLLGQQVVDVASGQLLSAHPTLQRTSPHVMPPHVTSRYHTFTTRHSRRPPDSATHVTPRHVTSRYHTSRQETLGAHPTLQRTSRHVTSPYVTTLYDTSQQAPTRLQRTSRHVTSRYHTSQHGRAGAHPIPQRVTSRHDTTLHDTTQQAPS